MDSIWGLCAKYNCKVYLWENTEQFSNSFTAEKTLQDIWSCQKHPWRHLIYIKTEKSLKCGPVQNVHGDIWSMPKGPWYLILSKTSRLKKFLWVQIAHNVNLYFWLTELIHKKYYHVLLVQQLCCGYITNNNPS